MIKIEIKSMYDRSGYLSHIEKTVKILGIKVYTKTLMPIRRNDDKEVFEIISNL